MTIVQGVLASYQRTLEETSNAIATDPVLVAQLGKLAADVVMADRKQIARDLHDKVGSGITLALCHLDMLEAHIRAERPGSAERPDSPGSPDSMASLARARESLADVLESTRAIVAGMRHVVPPGSLERELRVFAQCFATAGPVVDVTVSGDEKAAPPDCRDGLFVILREALRNALVHAFAHRVVVRARFGEGSVTGVVEDDGVGLGDGAGRPGNGLASMRERAEILGGRTEITSQPGRGTRVAVTFPLPGAAAPGPGPGHWR
ncbi:MAG: hypothetical protein J2P25_21340 [Nocardiopsaceae bacterium]|nr:hypothetical protein [Nocardiopsaceae bacterium]